MTLTSFRSAAPSGARPAAGAVDLDEVMGHLPDAVLLVETDASLVWANTAAETLFGLTVGQAAGLSGLDFIHPDDIALAALSMTSVQGKEVGTPIELRILSHQGWRLVEVVGSPVGERILLSIRDLTERRRWEVAGDEIAMFRSVVQNSDSVMMLVRSDGNIASSSAAVTRILGHDPEWLQGRPLHEIIAERDRGVVDRTLRDLCRPDATTRRAQVTLHLRDASDGEHPFAVTVANLLDDPTVEGFVVSGHDITDVVMAEAELRAANAILAATLEATADGIVVVDSAGRVTSSNARFSELGMTDPNLSMTGSLMVDVLAEFEDRAEAESRLSDLDAAPELESRDVITLRDGRVIELDSRPQRIHGRVVGRVWSFRDITEHRRLEDELTHRAFHDSLTDLPNQALFRDRVEHAIARLHRSDERLAVLFVDLDEFKSVNDSLGHPAGDGLLQVIADRLSVCLRQSDTVARLGGDEFAVLLEGLSDEREALEVARRINETLHRPARVGPRRLMTSASIGIAFGDTHSDCDDLLRNADLAMYRAKASGKNCYRVFEAAMHQLALDRFEIEADLQGVVARGEIVVHYQPIYEVATGRVAAMEALVRWEHPTRGLMSPDQFILLAEELCLINELGAHVLVQACNEAARWGEMLGDDAPSVTVNLSTSQLLDPQLTTWIHEALAESGLPASRLVLEITETALLDDAGGAIERLDELSALGIRLAVDDFGTGYSALSYLQQLPIDMLKIDKSFLDAVDSGRGASLVRAIVQLAASLSMTSLAEGVETAEHYEMLRSLGCDLVQGFYLSPPVAAEEARELLEVNAR